ncbi:serine hydrolase domain-containing protein [Streptomyces monticola]|uniref:Serine hydrolase domain-containing protein n=1 Tax=Streptomyces monticola TaxID=2666263 RepID=A0ABW2JLM4_9ACTN
MKTPTSSTPRPRPRLRFRLRPRRRSGALLAALGVATVMGALSPAAPTASAAQPAASLEPASIDRYVRDYLEQTGLPGAAVAVTRGDRVVHSAGYGRTASGQSMTGQTRLPVASLSKSMTALAVMQLAEAGKVDLDEPVRRYLPEFTMADRRAEKITVRQLLTQTSGMADSAYPDLTRTQPHTLKEAVAAMREAPLAAAPGTKFRYHNPNYFVAARLVEVVSGRPFADYLSAHLFKPLHMTHTASVDSTEDMPDQARGYVRAYGEVFARSHPRWFSAGGHGVVTTADDLSQWLIAQNNQGVSADGRRIAAARTIDMTHTPPSTPKDTDYAMGWSQNRQDSGPRQIQHTGQLLTQNSMATLLPESKVGIAVITNTGMLSGDDAPQIIQGLVDLAEGKQPEVAAPFSMTGDWVLAALTLLAAGLGIRGVLRAGRWADRTARKSWWRVALRILPQVLPILLFTQLAALVGLLMNRSGTLDQVTYAWPALVVCAAAGALASTAVITSRAVRVLGRRRREAVA